MERLTYEIIDGGIVVDKEEIKEFEIEDGITVYGGNAILRLAEYEYTDLTPGQIREIDKLYAEKCRKLAEYQKIGSVDDFEFYKKENDEESYEFCGEYGTEECQFKDLIDDYRNGLLLRLPCKIGDTVWVSPNNGKSFHTGKIYGRNEKGSHLVFVDDNDKHCVKNPLDRAFYDWFRAVYTRGEAEAKLAEMEGNHE